MKNHYRFERPRWIGLFPRATDVDNRLGPAPRRQMILRKIRTVEPDTKIIGGIFMGISCYLAIDRY